MKRSWIFVFLLIAALLFSCSSTSLERTSSEIEKVPAPQEEEKELSVPFSPIDEEEEKIVEEEMEMKTIFSNGDFHDIKNEDVAVVDEAVTFVPVALGEESSEERESVEVKKASFIPKLLSYSLIAFFSLMVLVALIIILRSSKRRRHHRREEERVAKRVEEKAAEKDDDYSLLLSLLEE